MLKFDLENMTKVVNPEYLPIGSVIDVKTIFDDSELMLVCQIDNDTGVLMCQCGNRWGEQITLKIHSDVKMKMVAFRSDIYIPSCEKVNVYYIPTVK